MGTFTNEAIFCCLEHYIECTYLLMFTASIAKPILSMYCLRLFGVVAYVDNVFLLVDCM